MRPFDDYVTAAGATLKSTPIALESRVRFWILRVLCRIGFQRSIRYSKPVGLVLCTQTKKSSIYDKTRTVILCPNGAGPCFRPDKQDPDVILNHQRIPIVDRCVGIKTA